MYCYQVQDQFYPLDNLDSFVGDFLKAGDSLYKASGMDTFYIYRDNTEYYFIVGKIINED